MGRTKRGLALTGVVLVDKPQGVTSNWVLQQVKRLYQAQKAGHTGNLDPLATGVLPICLGEATKLAHYMLESDKTYRATARLGIETDTGDADGAVISQQPIPNCTDAQIRRTLARFMGEQMQIPPMYSALKHAGQPLYKLARQGVEVERKPRAICVYQLELLAWQGDTLSVEVTCSKGTYIRTLLADIAKALGTCAHLTALQRTAAAGFQLTDCIRLDDLQDSDAVQRAARILPANAALTHWPSWHVSTAQAQSLRYGQVLTDAADARERAVKLIDPQGRLMGLGQIDAMGNVRALRLLNEETPTD